MRKNKMSIVLALMALLLLIVPVSAKSSEFLGVIQLPIGFQPEGIALGTGTTFFTGSVATGAIFRGDMRTGEGDILVPGQTGTSSTGMKYDQRSNALFVAGATTGTARVFDATSGKLLASYKLADAGNFINDIILTCNAAYITNSSLPVLYKLPLGPDGSLPDASQVETITLSGDWVQVTGFNANGIEATQNGKWLIVVNSTVGKLYRVDPNTGVAKVIDIGSQSVSNGDGLLLRGSILYVVRNQNNEVVVVKLSNDLTSGKVVDVLTNPNFVVPTTAAAFGNGLYTVNAKFGLPSPETLPYEIVRTPIHAVQSGK
jgi:sugar lactone lactonase YvrE